MIIALITLGVLVLYIALRVAYTYGVAKGFSDAYKQLGEHTCSYYDCPNRIPINPYKLNR